ncbi:unnamed protein product, partial [Brassica oleracea var. botrytis]
MLVAYPRLKGYLESEIESGPCNSEKGNTTTVLCLHASLFRLEPGRRIRPVDTAVSEGIKEVELR